MKILLTGVAGFIGHTVALRLLARGDEILGIDNLNDYYDVKLKLSRLERLKSYNGFEFQKLDIVDRENIKQLFNDHGFDAVVHLAAQAGVRYSLENPHAYIDANLVGFINILEGCRHSKIKHLLYASSSSVYGANGKMPFSESDSVDHPVSLYAATKKANELMAHSYAHLYKLPVTGLRFFTVYGPWGRPDMALFKFTKSIIEGKPIDVYNYGDMIRDFTYIDDIVTGVVLALDKIPSGNLKWQAETPDLATSYAPYKIYNIGNHSPVKLMDFITSLEHAIGKKAVCNMMPLQPGDVVGTFANVNKISEDLGFKPNTMVQEGINKFIQWYLDYYQINTEALTQRQTAL